MAGTVSALGLGSGLQLQDILDQMRQADEAPLTRYNTQKTQLQQQITAFDQLNSDLLNIRSKTLTLGLDTSYIGRSVSLSNDTVLAATVSDGAAVGSHSLTVSQLATASSWQGAGMSAATDVVNATGGDETFSYHVGSDAPVNITVADGTTLQGLADLINKDTNNPGVTASVVDTGNTSNSYTLVLRANDTGEASRITIDSQLSAYGLTEVQGASGASLDAQLLVDGIAYQRGANSGISDIIGGVTMNLKEPGTVSVSVASDTASLSKTIQDMVSGFNTVINTLKDETGYDDNGDPKLLTSVGAARTLGPELVTLAGATVKTGGSIESMYDLGLSINSDGTLSLDTTKLDAALASSPSDVQAFFTGDSSQDITGFADTLSDRLRSMTRPITGAMAAEQTAAQDKIDRIDTMLETTKARLDKKYAIMAQQFSQLDSFMSQMQSTSDYLTNQFKALTSTSSSSSS